MNILIVDNQTQYLEQIKAFFSEEDTFNVISCFDVTLEDANNADLIILTGSLKTDLPAATHADDVLKNEIDIIKNCNKPIIGIRYGCELIANTFGCEIKRIPDKTINFIEILPEGELLKFPKSYFKVFDSHKYFITEISDQIEGWAKSHSGYEVIKHKTKPIYGTMFSPEQYQDLTEGDDVLRKIIEIIKTQHAKPII